MGLYKLIPRQPVIIRLFSTSDKKEETSKTTQKQHIHDHSHDHDHSKCTDPTHNHDHHHHERPIDEDDHVLNTIREYREGMDYLYNGEFIKGYNHLKEVRNILLNVKMNTNLQYIKLLTKLAACALRLHQYKDCRDFLEERVDVVQDVLTDDVALYSSYNDLFAFYLRSDIDRCILLGKALDSEEEKQKIPVYLIKLFILHTAVS